MAYQDNLMYGNFMTYLESFYIVIELPVSRLFDLMTYEDTFLYCNLVVYQDTFLFCNLSRDISILYRYQQQDRYFSLTLQTLSKMH